MMSARVLVGIGVWTTIAVLIVLGAVIALRSGVGEFSNRRDYLKVAGNLSQMVLRIVGYVAILITLQHMIGLRSSLGW